MSVFIDSYVLDMSWFTFCPCN